MKKAVIYKSVGLLILGAVVFLGVAYWFYSAQMFRVIGGYSQHLLKGTEHVTLNTPSAEVLANLPAPVQRYFKFAFPYGFKPMKSVSMKMKGKFRRPGTTGWEDAQTIQYISGVKPQLVFYGDTGLPMGLWATMMDSYIDGHMHMEARLLSAIKILEKNDDEALNDLSAMRYLIEGPMMPGILLPGPHLRWQGIDKNTARAIAYRNGREVGAYRISFAEDGAISEYHADYSPADQLDATKVHGAGEVAIRKDYRLVNGVMIPHRFEIARDIEGGIQPFWRGTIERVEFNRTTPFD